MAKISGVQGYWQVDLIVNETNSSIENNTSTTSWELWIRRTYASDYPMYGSPTINIQISGKTAYDDTPYFAISSITQNGVKLLEGTVNNIPHNSDGTIVSNNVSFTWTGSGFSPNNVSGSGTYETSVIPRASKISATSAYVGEVSQINVTQYSPDFSHTIEYAFKDLNGYVLADGTLSQTSTKITALSIGMLIPISWYNQIPNDSEEKCTLTIKTYKDNTQIGDSVTFDFHVRVNETTSKPIVTASIEDTNQTTLALTGDSNILIKDYSTASVTWTVTAQNGSSISNVEIDNLTVQSSPSSIIPTKATVDVTATDSRDFSTTYNPTFVFKNYSKPNYNIDVSRVSPTSKYAKLLFNGTWFNDNFGSVDNTLTITWKYRESGTSQWTTGGTLQKDIDYTISDNAFFSGTSTTASEIQIGGQLEYEDAWDIALEIEDELETILIIETMTKGIPIVNWEDTFFNVNGDIRKNNTSIFTTIIDEIYPVGSIYMSVDSTKNPNTLFSGTEWQQLKDKFLLGAGDAYTSGDTGGEATVTLNINQIPSHSHTQYVTANSGTGSIDGRRDYSADETNLSIYPQGTDTGNTGGGAAHNNMPPYLVVCMWKRIS